MSEIPEEIKNAIADLASKYAMVPAFTGGERFDHNRQIHFSAGELAGYSLRDAEVLKLQDEVERLKETVESISENGTLGNYKEVINILQTHFTRINKQKNEK